MIFPLSHKAPQVSQEEISKQIDNIANSLSKQSSNQKVVYPTGDGSSGVFIFGENPGNRDTLIGQPFTVPYSEMFNQVLLPSVALTRENIYLTNLVKFNLPANRDPTEDEIIQGEPIVINEILFQRPKLVVAMGKFAAGFLLGDTIKISRVRGSFYHVQLYEDYGMPCLFLYHPAAAYHNPQYSEAIKQDFLLIRDFLNNNNQEMLTYKSTKVEMTNNSQNLF